MDTHQQPSSREVAEAWYKALPEIVMPEVVGERRWTVRPEEVAALLTSHSEAIRESIDEVRSLMAKDHPNIDERVAFYAACNEMEKRILALLNDSDV